MGSGKLGIGGSVVRRVGVRGELGSQIVAPPFSPHFLALPHCPTFLPTLPRTPHPNTLSTPLPTSQTHFPTPQTHFHTPTPIPHTSPYFPTPPHTFPHLNTLPTPPTHLTYLLLPPQHHNTFPHSFHISPILDPTAPTTKHFPIPPPSILPQILYTPMLPPLVLLCLLVLSVICGLQTACKHVVAAN